MKHTIPGEPGVTRWLERNVIPRVSAEGFLFTGEGAAEALGGKSELKAMAGHAFIGVDCTYLAESLGTLIIFRRSNKPFSGDDLDLLKAAGPVFATALTNLVHDGGRDASGDKQQQSDEDESDWWRRSA
jgi:hypothetical protein